MPNPKPFSVNFTIPSHTGAPPVKGGVTFASFEEVSAAAKAWSPNAVARADGSIVDSAGKQIGSYVSDTPIPNPNPNPTNQYGQHTPHPAPFQK
jgi:hypothetical protein